MAIALGFRIAIGLGVAGQRIVKWAEGPGPGQISETLANRLGDPSESDADLEAAVSMATGRVASVATFNAPFEARRMQAIWSRSGAGGTAPQDVAVTTHDWIKLAAGAPVDAWAEVDFATVEGNFDAFWGAILGFWTNGITLDQLRWYRIGPAVLPPQQPVRVVERNAPGISGDIQLPPQVAASVTERTSVRRSWGRFFLPAPSVAALQIGGRLSTAFITAIADAADAMYEACRVANVPGIVYSPTSDRALTVDTVQVDDLPDVMRSRRYASPLLRIQRGIG